MRAFFARLGREVVHVTPAYFDLDSGAVSFLNEALESVPMVFPADRVISS